MQRNRKLLASGTALVVALSLGVAGVSTASAYFSDTVTGGMIVVSEALPEERPLIAVDTFCGPSAGDITCDIYSGDPAGETSAPVIDFSYPYDDGPGLTPLTVSQSITVVNTGDSAQDVYLQFGSQVDAINAELGAGASLQVKVNGDVVAAYGKVGWGFNEVNSDPVQLANDLPAQGQITVTFTFTPDANHNHSGEVTIETPYRIYATDETGETVDSNNGGRILIDVT